MSMDLAGPGGGHGHLEHRLRSAPSDAQTALVRLTGTIEKWSSALRLHHWAKNLLLFVPLFLGHIAGDASAWRRTLVGVLALGLVASATYLLNDLNDLDFDRLHPAKKFRAIASGRVGLWDAGFAAIGLLVAGLTIAWLLSPSFAALILVYLALTAAYSVRLKREPLVDVAVIGGLFTLRLLMGAVLDNLTPSPWMLSFAAFFFFSLSLAKRHAEIMRGRPHGAGKIAGRGYQNSDWPLTLAFGIAAGLASIVVMLLFIALEAQVSGSYRSPHCLMIVPVCVSLWLMRIWVFSHRMTLDDDPVFFAFKDWVSYVLGAVIVVGWALAV